MSEDICEHYETGVTSPCGLHVEIALEPCSRLITAYEQRQELYEENKKLREALEGVVAFYMAYQQQGELQDRGMYCAMDMLTVADKALKEVEKDE